MSEEKVSTKKPTNNNSKYIIVVIAVIAVGGLSFFGGTQYQKSQDTNASPMASSGLASRLGGAGGYGQMGGGRRNANGAFGQVTAISSTNITINDIRQGKSKTYTINSDTKITDQGQTATATDIKNGDTVIVSASTTDSTIASTIRIGGGMMPTPDSSTPTN